MVTLKWLHRRITPRFFCALRKYFLLEKRKKQISPKVIYNIPGRMNYVLNKKKGKTTRLNGDVV